ncbi:MAG: transposase family protein [Sphingomonadales bacterium]|nr:transposase family protein [Sphingomonadales bacterium]
MISDQELLKLWRDPSFNGSYRGVRTFQVLLKTDLNIDVPLTRLYKVLSQDQIYLIHQPAKRHFDRRKYYVHNYGELCQMDIAHMFKDKDTNFQYFLLFVDVFSSKTFTVPLKTRETDEVLEALKQIIADFKSSIYEIQSDRESAFLSKKCKKLFADERIIFKPKFGKNKAAIGYSYITFVRLIC